MSPQTINLGILAHVDAGKTSLTERLLFDHGVTDELGSVDGGSTQTDSLALERERGITIRTAVAGLSVDGLDVNLVDTPGHPDFIAEVDRALTILDAAILVVSAVEGVQGQTRLLFRSLARASLPVVIFVNKIDRPGARYESLLHDLAVQLRAGIVAVNAVTDIGSRSAVASARGRVAPSVGARNLETLALGDEALLERLVEGRPPSPAEVDAFTRDQARRQLVRPVCFGSALTGQGVSTLMDLVTDFASPPERDHSGGLLGQVFALERSPTGERSAWVRVFRGEMAERQRVVVTGLSATGEGQVVRAKVGRIRRVNAGTHAGPEAVDRSSPLTAGEIGLVRGLGRVRVGSRVASSLVGDGVGQAHFAPPWLESLVTATSPQDEARLHAALIDLADDDPLMASRTVPGQGTSVLLYGEVQREVLAERLRRDYGLDAAFGEVTPVYVERPAGHGYALRAFDKRKANLFWATVGLAVEPGRPASGIGYATAVEFGILPKSFHVAIRETVFATLTQGLQGWPVTDCLVTLREAGWQAPVSTAGDFRDLTPLVLLAALRRAGTWVSEPCETAEVEGPSGTSRAIASLIVAQEGELESVLDEPSGARVKATVPSRRLRHVREGLVGITHGEGTVFAFASPDRRVRGRPPVRTRTDGNPLVRDEYLRWLSDRSLHGGAR